MNATEINEVIEKLNGIGEGVTTKAFGIMTEGSQTMAIVNIWISSLLLLFFGGLFTWLIVTSRRDKDFDETGPIILISGLLSLTILGVLGVQICKFNVPEYYALKEMLGILK